MATTVEWPSSCCNNHDQCGTLLKHLSAPVDFLARSPLLPDTNQEQQHEPAVPAPDRPPTPPDAPPPRAIAHRPRFYSLPTTIKTMMLSTMERMRSLRKPRAPTTQAPPHDPLLQLLQHQLPPGTITVLAVHEINACTPW